MHVHLLFACAMSLMMFPCWQACNVSSLGLLLHCLHVTSPNGALTPCHSSPSNFHQGTVFTRASKEDHFLEKVFKYVTRCTNGVRTPPRGCAGRMQPCGGCGGTWESDGPSLGPPRRCTAASETRRLPAATRSVWCQHPFQSPLPRPTVCDAVHAASGGRALRTWGRAVAGRHSPARPSTLHRPLLCRGGGGMPPGRACIRRGCWGPQTVGLQWPHWALAAPAPRLSSASVHHGASTVRLLTQGSALDPALASPTGILSSTGLCVHPGQGSLPPCVAFAAGPFRPHQVGL